MMMKQIRFSVAVLVAILALGIGRASAFNLVPPSSLGGSPGVGAQLYCPALAGIVAGSNGLWSVTDAQCFKGALNAGWSTISVPQTLTPASTVNIDLSKGCSGSIAFPTAGQNVTLTATNPAFCTGKDVAIYTAQPASGTTNNTLTFSTGFTNNAGAFPAVKTGTSATDVVTFKDNGTLVEYPVMGANFLTTAPGVATAWAGGAATVAQGATDYFAWGSNGNTSAQGTQATALVPFPIAGTAYDLSCRNATAADNSTGVVYTVYGGAAGTSASTITCTTASTGTPSTTLCSDTTHTFAVAAGDLLNVKVVNGNSAAANGVTGCSFVVH